MVPTILIMGNLNRANEFFLKKKFNQSIIEYNEILKDDPQNLIALNNLGYVLSKLKKFNEALVFYDKSLKIKPNDKIVLLLNY